MWFTNVIKPTHRCNLSCVYCYNEDSRRAKMGTFTLRRTIEETFSFARSLDGSTPVDFIWHGGEPLLAGLDFFRLAVGIQKEVNRGAQYSNSVQTNGTLLNEAWVTFFQEERFDVSLSIDGPADVNDVTRHYADGRGSFESVMRGMGLLRQQGLPHGVCVVLSRLNVDKVEEILTFLSAQKLPFNVIPLTRSGSAFKRFQQVGLGPHDYAAPWIRLFDLWFESDQDGYVQCTDFIRKARAVLIGRPTDCIGQEQCGSHHISTDQNGFVYPCATLSGDRTWAYGNIRGRNLTELMASPVAKQAGQRKRDPHCARCKWEHVCHGGCMSRSIKFYGTH
ncbi:MAG: dynobactin maturation radical SAM/SPASM protein DynA, partial [Thermodesulfobacteriota bacterium]